MIPSSLLLAIDCPIKKAHLLEQLKDIYQFRPKESFGTTTSSQEEMTIILESYPRNEKWLLKFLTLCTFIPQWHIILICDSLLPFSSPFQSLLFTPLYLPFTAVQLREVLGLKRKI
jgi:hypothetical protein